MALTTRQEAFSQRDVVVKILLQSQLSRFPEMKSRRHGDIYSLSIASPFVKARSLFENTANWAAL